MKQTIVISFITLALTILLAISNEAAVAVSQDDEATRQCLDKVQKAIRQEGLKQLYTGDKRKLNEYCEQGDIKHAIGLIKAMGKSQKCTRALNDHIKRNNLDVDKELRGLAYGACRRGDLQKAIAVVDGAQTKVPPAPAEILSFVTSASKVKKGDSVTLSWQTANASTVMLGRFGASDFQNVEATGSKSISPEKTTTYVLMISQSTKGPAKTKSKKLQVIVSYDPVIFRFLASPSTIRRGIKSKLAWEVYAADKVTLDGVPVSLFGEKIVSPKRTQHYTLMARTGSKTIKEVRSVFVSMYDPPKLSPPFNNVELCRRVDGSGESFRCISPDGPFWQGDKIYVIARFKNLPHGQHRVKRIIYNRGFFSTGKWHKYHQEESSFQKSRTGPGEIAFEIPSSREGALKLELVLDNQKNTRSIILYCIDCPDNDEG